MHITYPHKAVTLYAVPHHILKIEMAGICGGIEYAVDVLIIAAKAALIFKLSVYKYRRSGLDCDFSLWLGKLDFNKSKAGLTPFLIAV